MNKEPPSWSKYAVAIGATIAALVVRVALDPVLGDRFPFATFILAIAVTAWYGGLWPALLSLALALAACVYFYIPPRGSFAVPDLDFQVGLGLYLFVGVTLAVLSESLHKARRLAESQQEQLEREIAERRRAQEQLHEQRQWLEATLVSIGDAVIATDNQGQVTFMNSVAENLTGVASADACGRPLAQIFRIVNETTRQPVTNPVDVVLEKGIVVGLANHTILLRPDGSELPIDDSAAPIKCSQGRVVGVILVFRDVTKKRADDRAIQDKVKQLEGVARLGQRTLESRRLGEVLTEAATVVVDVLGVDMAGIFQFLPDRDALQLEAGAGWPAGLVGQAKVGNGRQSLAGFTLLSEKPVVVPDVPGERRFTVPPILQDHGVQSAVSVIIHGFGKPLGTFAALSKRSRQFTDDDVQFLQAIAQLVAQAIERDRLLRQLEQRVKELGDADRRKDEFLAMLAHELRNPLAPLSNALDLMQRAGDDPETACWAHEVMERQIQHIVRLVDDLLDVSRITRGKIQLRIEPVELAEIVRRAVESVQPAIEAQRHELTVSLPEEAIWLDADAVRLVQSLGNLLTNAAKYTPPGGKIAVTCQREGLEAVLKVRDTGVGIAPEVLPRIFDLFAQGERNIARSEGGLGIGLTLVRGLVEMHGGSITARSEGIGKGSEFTVRLPARASQHTIEPVDWKPHPMPRRRILVVEDNVGTAIVVTKMLTTLWGHEVQMAHDGRQAIEAALSFHPQIMLLDIGLPGMSGWEVVESLRGKPEVNGTLFVALTGYAQAEDYRRSREAGFDEHLVKPASASTLERLFVHPKLEPVAQ
jgi:PAS domain S-box-containing protein